MPIVNGQWVEPTPASPPVAVTFVPQGGPLTADLDLGGHALTNLGAVGPLTADLAAGNKKITAVAEIDFHTAGNVIKDDGTIIFAGIPTADPHVAGQFWNNAGALKVSAG